MVVTCGTELYNICIYTSLHKVLWWR